MGVSYAIIIWCNWNIYKHIKRYSEATIYNAAVVEVQTQIARAFVIQAIIPLITFGLPIFLVGTALISPINIPQYLAATLGIFLSYVPLSNGLSMLFYVKPYRMFARATVRKLIQNVLFNHPTIVSHTLTVRPHSKVTG